MTSILTIAVGGLVLISLLTIYIVAFFQGRDISFWPPTIGAKPKWDKKSDQVLQETQNVNTLVKHLSLSTKEKELLIQIGVDKVYENLLECKDDMRADFEKASDIRMLLQIGRRELGDGISSFFF